MWEPIKDHLLKNTIWEELQGDDALTLAEDDLALLNKAFTKEKVEVKVEVQKVVVKEKKRLLSGKCR